MHAHIRGNRTLVEEHLGRVRGALAGEPTTAFDIVTSVYGDALSQQNAHWLLSQVLGYLTHLQSVREARCIEGSPERWAA